MAFFKRPEVWVLLLLSVAGVAWVLWSDSARDRAEREEAVAAEEETANEDPGVEASRFAIRERRVSREGGHLIITLRVSSEADRGLPEALALEVPAVRLVTEDGASVAPFFLPFDPPPVLDTGSGAYADLRYWLPVSQASEALWLEIDGERLPVKEAGGETELAERFPEGTEIAVNGLDWRS